VLDLTTVRDLEGHLIARGAGLYLVQPDPERNGFLVEIEWNRTIWGMWHSHLRFALGGAIAKLDQVRTPIAGAPDVTRALDSLVCELEPAMPLADLERRLRDSGAELRRGRFTDLWSLQAWRAPARAIWVAVELERAIVGALDQLDFLATKEAGLFDLGGEGDAGEGDAA
jgi:hypothetical protein